MTKLLTLAFILSLSIPALAKKSCDELKAEIDEKFKAKGVVNYTLTITDNAEVKDQKVVGSCNGGTQKIVYTRNK
ncbi:MAG: DUF1161 domain-containing protein [Bdellovibrionaceae bacterium]|nr:DUF1161 domain-containing protein [Pseudobdellovibrionaceae bacterium]